MGFSNYSDYGYDKYGYDKYSDPFDFSYSKHDFYNESLAFTVTDPKAQVINANLDSISINSTPVSPLQVQQGPIIPTVAMFDYEFRAIIAPALADAPAEDALAIYDVIVPGAEFCMGAHRYNEDQGCVVYALHVSDTTDYVLKCPGDAARGERANPYGRRMDDRFYAVIGVDPDSNVGKRPTYKVLIKASANETVPLIYRDSDRPRPQFNGQSYATEIELLDFANRLRKLGGANVIDAFMPSSPGQANACLIANALNFGASVSPVGIEGATWRMTFPLNVKVSTVEIIAHALGLDHVYLTGREVSREVVLPKLVGNAAWAFDRAETGWVTKYRKSD
jgi:hypothetical protein